MSAYQKLLAILCLLSSIALACELGNKSLPSKPSGNLVMSLTERGGEIYSFKNIYISDNTIKIIAVARHSEEEFEWKARISQQEVSRIYKAYLDDNYFHIEEKQPKLNSSCKNTLYLASSFFAGMYFSFDCDSNASKQISKILFEFKKLEKHYMASQFKTKLKKT